MGESVVIEDEPTVEVSFFWDVSESGPPDMDGRWVRIHLPEPQGSMGNNFFVFAVRFIRAFRKTQSEIRQFLKEEDNKDIRGVFMESWIVAEHPWIVAFAGFNIPSGQENRYGPEFGDYERKYAYMHRKDVLGQW